MESTNIKIREALLRVGLSVDGIWDLVNTNTRYPEAIPILIDLSQTELDDRSKEGVIRALAVKEAKGKNLGAILIKEFNKTPKVKSSLRWVIGNTMDVVITKDDLEGVLDIVTNKENGTSRQMFVFALGKMKLHQVEDTLIELLDDDDVVLHAMSSLKKLKSKRAIDKMKNLLNHRSATVRKRAKKYLNKYSPI